MASGQYVYSNQVSTQSAGSIFFNGTTSIYINQVTEGGDNLSYILNSTLNKKCLIFLTTSGNNGYSFEVSAAPTVNNSQVVIPVTLLFSNPPLPVAGTVVFFNLINSLVLEELSDVNITAPSNGQVLQYDSGTQTWVNGAGGGGGGGTVTSVTAGTGLSASPANPIVTSGTLAISNTAVTAGSYVNANVTVNAQGQLTAASDGTVSSVVWQQGGITTDPNYFTGTCAQLSAYIAANTQLVNVYVDDTLSTPTIDAPLDCLSRVAFVGRNTNSPAGSPYAVMTVSANGYFLNPYSFNYVLIQPDGTSNGELIRTEMNSGNQNLTFENFRLASNLDFPMIKIVPGTNPTTNQVVVFKQGSIDSSANNVNGAVEVPLGCSLTLVVVNANQSWGDVNKVFSGAGSIFNLVDSNNYGANLPSNTQSLVSGSFAFVFSAIAARVVYDDSLPPNIGAGTVQQAIDILKAAPPSQEIFADFGAFAAGQQATYNSTTSHFANPKNPSLQFCLTYDDSQTTTPAAGKFSIQDVPNVLFCSTTSADGVSLATLLPNIPMASYGAFITNPFGMLKTVSKGTLNVGNVSFDVNGALHTDYTNGVTVTFNITFLNVLYHDQLENLSTSDKANYTGGAQRNNAYSGNIDSGAIYSGDDNTLVGNHCFDPVALITASQVTAVGANALHNAGATGVTTNGTIAIGYGAMQFADAPAASTGVGYNSLLNDAAGQNTALGYGALSAIAPGPGNNNTAVGSNAGNSFTGGTDNCLFGSGCQLTGNNLNSNVVIGAASASGATSCVVVGDTCVASADTAIAIGSGANSDAVAAIAIGSNAIASAASTNSVAIGQSANVSQNGSVAIGSLATNASLSATVVGASSVINTGCGNSVAFGTGISVNVGAVDSVAIGTGVTMNGAGSICIGNGASCADNGAIVIGATGSSHGSGSLNINGVVLDPVSGLASGFLNINLNGTDYKIPLFLP